MYNDDTEICRPWWINNTHLSRYLSRIVYEAWTWRYLSSRTSHLHRHHLMKVVSLACWSPQLRGCGFWDVTQCFRDIPKKTRLQSWNNYPPSPPTQWWRREGAKNAPFWYHWNGGRGGPDVPFILSKIVGLCIDRMTVREPNARLPPLFIADGAAFRPQLFKGWITLSTG